MDHNRPAFLITIDTEGDDLWSRPHEVRTQNSRWIPRFQQVCEDHGLIPTYLTNYEMAVCPFFQRFGKKLLRQGTAKIGMHLHAWNSPPIAPLTADDYSCAPYLTEYPAEVMREKIAYMTALLQDTFECEITSHRAGRWGFNGTYAGILRDLGYRVDCSVTPGVSWASDPGGTTGGPDYSSAPRTPYILDHTDVCREGNSGLWEVPMTVVRSERSLVDWVRPKRDQSLAGRALNRWAPKVTWLQPNGRNLESMLRLLDGVIERGESYAEFTLHSSELMPGASPRFPTADSIESLYHDLHVLFEVAARGFRPSTLTAFAEELPDGQVRAA